MSSWVRRAFALWLPGAVMATVLAGVVYVAVQQAHRSDANDPQLQMARDAASSLDAGATPQQVAAGSPVDMMQSLAPWIAVYGQDGTALASTATFDGHPPVPPAGLIDDARSHELDLTWEPRSGVRAAIVAVPFGHGVVVAGRSLQAVEQRVDRLTWMVGLGWLATLGAGAVAAAIAAMVLRGGPAPLIDG